MRMVNYKMSVLLILLLAGTISAFGQPRTDRSLEVFASDRPEIIEEIDGNKVKLFVAWDEVNYSADPDPIISVGQTEDPRWEYFWILGDGLYRRGDTIEHVYPRTNTDEWNVELYVRGIYTNDSEPPITRKKVKTNPAPTLPTNIISNFDGETPTTDVLIDLNWNSAIPGDTLVAAVSLRQTSTNEGESEGRLYFLYPSDQITVLGVSGQLNDLSAIAPPGDLGADQSALAWEFNNLQPGRGGERTIFIEMRLSGDMSFFEDNPGQVEIEDQDGNPVLVLNDDAFPVSLSAGVDFGLPDDSFSGGIFGGFGQDGGTTIPNPNFFAPDELRNKTLNVRLSRDPNSIDVEPAFIVPGQKVHEFKYTVNFQNFGSGSARKVEVDSEKDEKLALTSFDETQTIYEPDGPDFSNGFKPGGGAGRLQWKLERTDQAPFLPGTGELSTIIQGDIPAVAYQETMGSVKYRLDSKNLDWVVGDTVKGIATIFMDEVPLRTGPVYTLVREPVKFRIPWYFGVKAGVNINSLTASTTNNGFHFGVTARKAFGSFAESIRNNERISMSAFPKFWYQAELMFSNFELQDDALYDSWYLDVVPLQIRFIPKALPGNALSILTSGRLLGFSAGYMASYLISTRVNDLGENLSPLSFSDRLDHSIFAGFEVLNLLGRPGISAGYRYHRRFGHLLEDRVDYNMNHIFVHYNF